MSRGGHRSPPNNPPEGRVWQTLASQSWSAPRASTSVRSLCPRGRARRGRCIHRDEIACDLLCLLPPWLRQRAALQAVATSPVCRAARQPVALTWIRRSTRAARARGPAAHIKGGDASSSSSRGGARAVSSFPASHSSAGRRDREDRTGDCRGFDQSNAETLLDLQHGPCQARCAAARPWRVFSCDGKNLEVVGGTTAGRRPFPWSWRSGRGTRPPAGPPHPLHHCTRRGGQVLDAGQ